MHGSLIVDDVEILIRAAIDGLGMAFMSEDRAPPHLATGALVRMAAYNAAGSCRRRG